MRQGITFPGGLTVTTDYGELLNFKTPMKTQFTEIITIVEQLREVMGYPSHRVTIN
ncbi:MAG: hypothetical protein WBA39_13860 [Rivularia sp. (in: cyanobacteria)]